jgi:ADP-ribosylglycohydrolase
MLGAVIGDIVGSRFEWNNYRNTQFDLFTPENFFTDDTVMTFAIAQALMQAQDLIQDHASYDKALSQLTVKSMQQLGRMYPNRGYGGQFGRWLISPDPRPYGSWGNGAAMRISPIGWVAEKETDVKSWATIVTRVSHDHEEAIKAAGAVARAIWLARHNFTKHEIGRSMENDYTLDFCLDDIRPTYTFDVSCQGSVPQALVAFLESDSFEDAIRLAVSIGGDSDTIAAITGSIAEAYYGIPEDIRQQALNYLDRPLRQIYRAWEQFLINSALSGDQDLGNKP